MPTVVNDRLRRLTEVNEDRSRPPCATSVYGAERQETDSVYDAREKIPQVDHPLSSTTVYGDKRPSFVVVYHRMRPYTIVVCIPDEIKSII